MFAWLPASFLLLGSAIASPDQAAIAGAIDREAIAGAIDPEAIAGAIDPEAIAGAIDRLRNTVETLAQPAWEGRLAGSKGGREARRWIEERFTEIGVHPLFNGPSFEQPITRWWKKKPIGVNVAGYLGPALPSGECIVVGAHYDGKGIHDGVVNPGADDNASGVAGLLELARIAKPIEDKLARCLILAAWDFEEGEVETLGGIKGSRFFAKHPPLPLERVALSMTFDLIGGHIFSGAEDTLFLFGTESSSSLRQLVGETPPSRLRAIPLSVKILEPLGKLVPRSDYGPFRSRGVPFLYLTTGTPRYYHLPTDTPDVIDYVKLYRVTRYAWALLKPLLEESNPIARGEKFADRRYDDLESAISVLSSLMEHADSNSIQPEERAHLRKELTKLAPFAELGSKRLPWCRLQVAFTRMLRALEVDRERIRPWLPWLLDLGCRDDAKPIGS